MATGAGQELSGVYITSVKEKPKELFDVSFDLVSGQNAFSARERSSRLTPGLFEEIAPWVGRIKSLRQVSFALLSPALSLQSQGYGVWNGINFLELAGNVYINVTGKFTLQR